MKMKFKATGTHQGEPLTVEGDIEMTVNEMKTYVIEVLPKLRKEIKKLNKG
jgi:hypothetical protein